MSSNHARIGLLVLAAIVFAITAFCAFFFSSSVGVAHLVGGIALAGVLRALAGIPV